MKNFLCPGCGGVLAREPRRGAIYFCPDCLRWFAPPGDTEAEKFLARQEAEDVAEGKKIVRRGPLPGPVLSKVRTLAANACANICGQSCIPSGQTCVFFAELSEVSTPHRCRWFEQAVLPTDPGLQAAYSREYEGTDAQMRRDARKAAAAGRAAAMRTCERCGREFPGRGRQAVCPICRRAARRQKNKERMRAARSRG